MLLVPIAVTVALLFRYDDRSFLAFRSHTRRDFVVRTLAVVSLGMMLGLASMGSVAMHARSDCVKLLNFCEPIRAEGRHVYRGWPIPWVSDGAVDDYDRASNILGFGLDVLLWFWMVSIAQGLGWLGVRLTGAVRGHRRKHAEPTADADP